MASETRLTDMELARLADMQSAIAPEVWETHRMSSDLPVCFIATTENDGKVANDVWQSTAEWIVAIHNAAPSLLSEIQQARADAAVSASAGAGSREGEGHVKHCVMWREERNTGHIICCRCGWESSFCLSESDARTEFETHVAAATGEAAPAQEPTPDTQCANWADFFVRKADREAASAHVIDAAAEMDGNTATGWLLCELIADEKFDDVIEDRHAVKVEVRINDHLVPFESFAEAIVKRIERGQAAPATAGDLRALLADYEDARKYRPEEAFSRLYALLSALVERVS